MASTQEFKTQIVLPADPSAAMQAATKQYVDTNVASTGVFPAGTVVPFAGSSAPSGWLLCAGQAVSRTTYANLFAIIGTTYGAGDGSTTFNLPDLRGRVPAGLDNMNGTDAGRLDWANTLGTNGGAQKHTLSLAEIPSHNHNNITGVNNQDHWHGQIQATVASGGGMVVGVASNGSGGAANGITTGASGTHNHNIAAEGGGGAHNNMQPTILLNYIISTGVGTTTRLWAEGRKTTTKTIPDVTSTTIDSFNAETDPYGMFNTSTGKFTLPVAGLWQFSVLWSFNADVANWNHHSINNETTGTAVASLRTASGPYINTLSAMQECAAGNVISFGIFTDTASGATLNYCRFNAALIGT